MKLFSGTPSNTLKDGDIGYFLTVDRQVKQVTAPDDTQYMRRIPDMKLPNQVGKEYWTRDGRVATVVEVDTLTVKADVKDMEGNIIRNVTYCKYGHGQTHWNNPELDLLYCLEDMLQLNRYNLTTEDDFAKYDDNEVYPYVPFYKGKFPDTTLWVQSPDGKEWGHFANHDELYHFVQQHKQVMAKKA